MKALLIGINSKYIHPSVALYQFQANTSYECDLIELTIKDSIEVIINKLETIQLEEKIREYQEKKDNYYQYNLVKRGK